MTATVSSGQLTVGSGQAEEVLGDWDRQIGRYFGDEPSGAAASVHACEGHGRGPTDACAYLASKGEQR